MKRAIFWIIPLCAGAIALAAMGEVQRPTGPVVKGCTEGECHTKERSYKVLHGPTALGACDTCHQPKEPEKHTYVLRQQNKALCDFCHVDKKPGLVMHKPVQDGQCLSCHNPHGAGNKFMLRKDDMGQLCATCHKDVGGGKKFPHGPFAAGSCQACHNSHQGDFKKLLVAEGKNLCLGCHDQMGKQLAAMKSTHKPVKDGECQQCHEVHASNHKMQLKNEPVALCESCHTQVKQQIADAKVKHGAVTEKDACLNCHTAHGSDMAKLTKADLPQQCMKCHDKPINASDGHAVAAVPEILNKNLSQHGPIREGNCSGCHVLHGGQVSRLLAKPYPTTFYESFDVEKYALCFTCHDRQLVLIDKTTGLTRFRNGDMNLHYLHVNKTEKGRSCRACHVTHASTHEKHLRDSVPFGKWELPINYKPTSTGGSCAPGCHKEAAYDRDKPAPRLNAVATPGAPAAPVITPAAPAITPAAPVGPLAPTTPGASPSALSDNKKP